MHNSSTTDPTAAAKAHGNPNAPGSLNTPVDPAAGTAQGLAHAKAILFGEHSVVYGSPALAVPLHGLAAQADVRASPGRETRIESQLFSGTVQASPALMGPVVTGLRAALEATGDASAEVELCIRSAIPHGRGLGSSAAVATALARAVAELRGQVFDPAALHTIVQKAETVAHGHPSGIDAWAVATPAPIRFQAGAATTIEVGRPLTFVLADSGHHGSTAEAVAGVRALRDRAPTRIDPMITRLADLTEGAIDDVRLGERGSIGARMREAHGLLADIGVSTPTLDRLVAAASAAGASGAKLTGGGLGGCVLALAESTEQAEDLADALRGAGAPRTWTTEVPRT